MLNNLKGPDIWIKKYVDYSAKYGLGYILSNGFCGVVFNVKTRIIFNPETINFFCIKKMKLIMMK